MTEPSQTSMPTLPSTEGLTVEQMRMLVDALPGLTWMANADGSIHWFNRRVHEYTGATLAEIRGWGWQKIQDPATLPQLMERWSECIRTGTPFEMECPIRGADGVYRPFLTRANPVRDDSGRVIQWIGTNTDISSQKKTEEALRVSEARFREAFECAPIGIVQCDREGRFLRVNPTYCEMTGFTEAELLGRHFEEITHPQDRAESRELNRRIVENRGWRQPIEKRYVKKDGRVVWVIVSGAAVLDQRGQVQHYVVIAQDITYRKMMENALKETIERCDLISRATNDVLWDWNLRDDSMWWGEGVSPQFGLRESTLKSWSDRVHPDDRLRVERGVAAALQSGLPKWEDEYRFRREDGSYATVRDRGFVVRDEQGQAVRVVGAMHDITEQKEAEMRLLEAQDELQRNAVRLESAVAERTARLQELVNELGTFSYSISHDLRAPLRAIHGFAELLREDVGAQLPDIDRSHLDRIIRAAERMDALIRDVLEYSRITRAELTLEKVDVAEVVRHVIDAHEQFHGSRADIQVIKPIPTVHASRLALTQYLSNLLGNAVKFVSPGTTPKVRVRGENAGHRVRIWVEDNGIGIAPESRDKIWGMLERLNPAYEGTGVGLSIVRKAVERMGGSVGVESTVGEGSQFWIELPKSE